ncbi:MAG: HAD family hydrolase [Jaaginema sp. PMC 1079.18]|nr:HAD family hydrolase [Jaaginema sp. PMC 1080.18]MEC4849561.1 HAD family hydrolase [Jaaginema sp. PMC 1079.18]
MTSLKAIIFDVDGTLAETERDGHRVAFNRSFNAVNLDWCWSESLYGELLQIAGGKERIRYYIEQYQPDFTPDEGRDRFIAQLHQAKTQYYLELLKTGKMPLRPGVKRLITEAHNAGIRLAIATTSALPNAVALLEQTLNPHWFEVIAAGDIVPAKKPAPDIYYYVLEQMQLQPSDCLVFEDSEHGLEAAAKVGIKTIVTANNYTRQQDFSEAVLVVDCLGERDRPCKVLSKQQLPVPYLDLAYLRQLHQVD